MLHRPKRIRVTRHATVNQNIVAQVAKLKKAGCTKFNTEKHVEAV
jgi:hypothetical protein